MTRKQIVSIAIVVLVTTTVGIVLTATMPIWLSVIFVMPNAKRTAIFDTLQARMAREMMKFMFRSKMAGKQAA